jgi:competence protein ComEA
MRGLKRLIRNFFGFSQSQANGFVGLLILLSILIFSEPVYRWWLASQPTDFSREAAQLDSIVNKMEWPLQKHASLADPDQERYILFPFNPNQTSEEELLALGFSKGLSKRIINYREKGGVFRTKADLKKMYGMDSVFYTTISSFILLPDKREPFVKEKFVTEKRKPAEAFNLNTADTTQLKALYGIGTVLAKRIITFREKLGGFTQMEQLKEVYKLDTTVIARIEKASFIEENFVPRRININVAEVKELDDHPYISEKIAKAIIAYRFQHGNFNSVDELKKVLLVDEALFTKIYPYLTIE